MTENRDRLWRLIEDRRAQLGWYQEDLAARAGISVQTLRSVRGDSQPRAATKAALERALSWKAGSIDAVLSGGEPTLLRDTPEPEDTPEDTPDRFATLLFAAWEAGGRSQWLQTWSDLADRCDHETLQEISRAYMDLVQGQTETRRRA